MAQFVLDLVYSFGNCLNCFPGSPTLKIKNRSFKILRLLGEGGFSYVYLVEDTTSHQLFALKKIRCPFGAESVQQAMREVDAYRLFAHVPSIISAVDHAVATERGGGGGGGIGGGADEAAKTVYVLLPYYRRGNLQDMINANVVNRGAFPERHLMMLFLGVCKALRAMHEYKAPPAERMQMGNEVEEQEVDDDDDDDDDDGTAQQQQQGEQQRPLMQTPSSLAASTASIQSYAHRDIKPGNIMIDDAGSTPILMDLGSVSPSPIHVTSASLALQIQDTAAEHSTMSYRAPELFDVRAGTTIDTKVDIWSLGCTLYACLVGKSPFEMRSDETGGTLSLCVLGGDWRFPDESPGGAKRAANPPSNITISQAKARAASGDHAAAAAAAAAAPTSLSSSSSAAESSTATATISEPIRHLVRQCLKVEPAERPSIGELIAMVETVLAQLPDDG
ncbi:hypothetical protein E4U55_001857 [Claviceps digitariae]|nr:hypothetical protein E4U55_001857 [Claviceps digitariae]